jgi:putative tricarboxylic transport membrane protein
MPRRLKLSGELLLALGIAALGLFFAVQTSAIEVSPSYARVGPRVFPWVVAGTLMALGLWLAREAWTGRWTSAEQDEHARDIDWRAFLLIGVGLVAHMALIGRAGFVIASTVLFVCVARAFGSRQLARATAIGFILTLIVFVGFTYGLGLELPAGVLAGLL